MTNINSLCLYFISFAPLWLAILFIDVKNIVDKDPNLCTEIISIISIILLFIISFIVVYNLIIDKRKSRSEKYTIINAKKSKFAKQEVDDLILNYLKAGNRIPKTYKELKELNLPSMATIMRFYESWREPFLIFSKILDISK